jgi:creatinine amidohydrolase
LLPILSNLLFFAPSIYNKGSAYCAGFILVQGAVFKSPSIPYLSHMIRPYILEETNWKQVKTTDYEVAILPWGATEAHNYHMPYGTDNYQVNHIAQTAAAAAWSAGAKVLILPTLSYGIQTGQLDIPFSMNLLPSTQMIIMKDICDILVRSGCNKLVIVNGHGGNNFKNIIRELSFYFPSLFVCSVNWWEAVPTKDYFDQPGDHADEFETSSMMHIRPDLLLPLEEAGDGSTKKFKIDALRKGWAQAQRSWTAITKDTGSGDPSLSTPDKGKQYTEACISRLSDFLQSLAKADLEDLYE